MKIDRKGKYNMFTKLKNLFRRSNKPKLYKAVYCESMSRDLRDPDVEHITVKTDNYATAFILAKTNDEAYRKFMDMFIYLRNGLIIKSIDEIPVVH